MLKTDRISCPRSVSAAEPCGSVAVVHIAVEVSGVAELSDLCERWVSLKAEILSLNFDMLNDFHGAFLGVWEVTVFEVRANCIYI